MIPLKKYLKVILIYAATIIICLFLMNWYSKYEEYQKTKPILRGTLQEITINDYESYINDNRDALIYIGASTDENCQILEPKLKELLKDRLLTTDVIYFNITDIKNLSEFYNEFNKKYLTDMKLSSYPAFVIIRDGKIRDLVEKKQGQELQIGDIEYLLDQYEITKEK